MKYRIFIFIICLFLYDYISGIAKERDSTMVSMADSLSKINNDPVNKGFDLIAISGLGIATGSMFNDWEKHYSTGPAMAIGIELPFTSAHIFSFELYGHLWAAKKIMSSNYYDDQDIFSNKFENIYSQMGLSAALKFYLGDRTDKLRLSFHLGYLLISPNNFYNSFEFGIGLYYYLNDKWSLYLTRRIVLYMPPIGGSADEDVPNLLILNICYKFKLVL